MHLEPTEGGSGEASHGEQSLVVCLEISMLDYTNFYIIVETRLEGLNREYI